MSVRFFFSFTLWMTCEMPLIHALPTLWIAPQNLPFRLSNSGYRMSAYLVGTNSIIKYASFICVEGWLLVTSIRTDSIVILFNSKRFCRNIDSYHFPKANAHLTKLYDIDVIILPVIIYPSSTGLRKLSSHPTIQLNHFLKTFFEKLFFIDPCHEWFSIK